MKKKKAPPKPPAEPTKRELTRRRQLFIAHYVKSLNGAAAARAAGYSTENARDQAYDLLCDPKIREEIRIKVQKKLINLDISAERVLAEVAKIAFTNLSDVMTWDETTPRLVPHDFVSPDAKSAIASIQKTETEFGSTWSIKMHPKLEALNLLGKYLKLFIDRKELTGKDGQPLVDSFSSLMKLLDDKANGNDPGPERKPGD